MSMTAVLLINLAVFAGAVVSGFAGFAFSAVAGAMSFRIGFGFLIALYAGYMLYRPAIACIREINGFQHALVGFGGGIIGGITAMPSALPTIWCDLQGMPKNRQRGLVQPYILAMQLFALALMLSQSALPSKILLNVAISLPALAAGTALGIAMFHRAKDTGFRRAVLGVLFFSGLALTF